MDKRTKAYIALLTTALIWGFAPPIIKYTLGFVNPVEFLLIRFLIVSILILPAFLIKFKKHPFKIKDLPMLILVALCGTSITLGLLFWGLSKTSTLDSAVISSTTPLMIVLAGAFFLKEIITKQEKLGLFLAFSGTAIAIISPLFNGKMFHSGNTFGNLLVFLSNLTWVTYSILSKKLAKKYPSFNITAFSFFVGLITFLPLFLIQNPDLSALRHQLPAALPGILYMSIFGSIIAYFTYTYGFSLIEASEATLFTYLQPLFTAPLAVLWLKETMKAPFIIGAVFIALGVFLTEYKPKKYKI